MSTVVWRTIPSMSSFRFTRASPARKRTDRSQGSIDVPEFIKRRRVVDGRLFVAISDSGNA
jgi:hypothetical protein